MSDDSINVLAGIEGLLSGISSVAVPTINRRLTLRDQYEIEKQRMEAEEQSTIRKEGRAFDREKAFIPLKEESEIRINEAKPRTTYVQQSDGTFMPIEGKVSKFTPSKKPRKIITSVQAQQLRDAGVDVNDQDYTIKDPTASGQKDVDKSDVFKWSISEIDRILPLNEKSSGGLLGAGRQKVMSGLNIEDEKFRNTADVVNSAKSMVADVLKSKFGGQLSDGERQYLNEVYGALEKYSVAERRIALNNVRRMMQNKVGTSEASGTPPGTETKANGLQVGGMFNGKKILKVERVK